MATDEWTKARNVFADLKRERRLAGGAATAEWSEAAALASSSARAVGLPEDEVLDFEAFDRVTEVKAL